MTNEVFKLEFLDSDKYEHVSKVIKMFNSLFDSKNAGKSNKKAAILILLLTVIEISYFFFIAFCMRDKGYEFSYLTLWFPVLIFFIFIYAFCRQKKVAVDHRIHSLHVEWLRKKILPECFPEYQYVYENKKTIQDTLLQAVQNGISDSICSISYTGCMLNANFDLYELAAFNNQTCLFAGVIAVIPEANVHQCKLNHIAEMFQENTGEKVSILREKNVYWIFLRGIGFDTLMFENPEFSGDFRYPIRPFDMDEFKKNYRILNQLAMILTKEVK